jgi:class 3 adenylate cyclase
MPSGTVTFLFTDIEGGTRRWQEEPEPMSVAVTRHDDILRDGIAQHRGVVFKTVADAFCVAFASVDEAVAAALDTQIALAGEPWPTRDPLRVRMALHTGGAELRDDDYFGPTLNKVARIMATANGGQTLLSTVTAELGRDLLPPDAELLDLALTRSRTFSAPSGCSSSSTRGCRVTSRRCARSGRCPTTPPRWWGGSARPWRSSTCSSGRPCDW